MMQCPLCEFEGARGNVHAHLVDLHSEAVEMWTDSDSGKMRYRVACPLCEEFHEARIKPRSHDAEFLEMFTREIRMVAFDMLLNHLEAEHLASEAGDATPSDDAPLPLAGPGGGRGRPGTPGVPLPPGMDEPDLPPWARALETARSNPHRPRSNP